ncbi:MAG: hypothetical protein JL50_09600 [Peptococcaceae bacterium BICA1-7]|nr:MAG: hypothetical protein JL50_09600 [Peptococcaceae bacterium BICA1-7]HBV95535.1 hypothetical protein [Desulfotomaculum sp.]
MMHIFTMKFSKTYIGFSENNKLLKCAGTNTRRFNYFYRKTPERISLSRSKTSFFTEMVNLPLLSGG